MLLFYYWIWDLGVSARHFGNQSNCFSRLESSHFPTESQRQTTTLAFLTAKSASKANCGGRCHKPYEAYQDLCSRYSHSPPSAFQLNSQLSHADHLLFTAESRVSTTQPTFSPLPSIA